MKRLSRAKNSPLEERAAGILHSIVHAYIDSGEPVASRTISRTKSANLSPASIRNIMADLSEAGYLSQPHTSAGRVPTVRAFHEYVRTIQVSRGPEPGGLVTCPACHGRGEMLYQQGFLSIRRTCTQCGGRRQVVRRVCQKCKGDGFQRTERKLKVTIPPGVDNNTRLRLSQEGQPGVNGGPPGDLYVVLKVKDHPVFERHEDQLHCTVPVNIAQAALGAEVDLLTFDGLKTVKIPEGAQNGDTVKLRGLGAPRLNSSHRGDLVVHVEVRVPEKITREQRKLLEQLREILPVENEPREKGLFEKVKEYFM